MTKNFSMGLLIILIITEALTPVVLRQHFYNRSRVKYYTSTIIHIILSMWLWILFIEITTYKGFFDTPRHIWLLMNHDRNDQCCCGSKDYY